MIPGGGRWLFGDPSTPEAKGWDVSLTFLGDRDRLLWSSGFLSCADSKDPAFTIIAEEFASDEACPGNDCEEDCDMLWL